jgi:cytochrome c biogenesis factor
VFPYINVLWLGCLVMAAGTIIAIIERIRKFRIQKSV